MKKKKNIEMRIYEFLGIKTFKKIVFAFRDGVWRLFHLRTPKEVIKKEFYHFSSNYNLGEVRSLEDVKRFKMHLLSNAIQHIFAELLVVPNFLIIATGEAPLATIITAIVCTIINAYCIMLQRYNHIRINQVIKRMTPIYEKQKEAVKEEIKKDEANLQVNRYKIVNKKGKESVTSFDDILNKSSLEELKKYRLYFEVLNNMNNTRSQFYNQDIEKTYYEIPMENKRTLKLEIRNNKKC